ncbi:probable G-protein coupled receptor 19 [Stylophora pistillata]|uniref:probable G-protein coupled receptor 19 n=1 Tax=Stylophora pistillata TaxID=50429 RepID=UPI000C056147|nr:probable G-protein coupled receptor 19 [Stylophora pistillata]
MNSTNENSTSSPLTSGYPLVVRSSEEVIFEIIVGCVLCLLGVTGNGFVCYVIHQSRYTKSSMYFFMAQLAIADILVSSISIPLTLVSTCPRPLLLLQSDIPCKMVRFLQYLLPPASVNILTATAVDRFLLICYPLKFLYRTKVKFLAIFCWASAIFIAMPVLYLINSRPITLNNEVYKFCGIKETSSFPKLGSTYLTIRGILAFLFPLLAIVLLYYNILKTVWKRNTIKSRKRRNVIKSLGLVVCAFFVSWAPFSVVSKYSILVEKRYDTISRAELITFWVGLSASVYNPVIYAFYNKNFRDASREVILRRRERRKTSVTFNPNVKVNIEVLEGTIPDLESGAPILLKHAKLA